MARIRLVLRSLQLQRDLPVPVAAIGEVHAIRRAAIELDHRPRRWFMRASDFVTVRASTPVHTDQPISCGIPGHDRPGEELQADVMRVADDPFQWDVHGRCGFASNFAHASDAA